MRYLQIILLCFLSISLISCSDSKPSGHVYTGNALGTTIPTPDLEIAFLPYPSRAAFFHEPISEAYKFATFGLDEALAPMCEEALAFVDKQTLSNNEARDNLEKQGNVPNTPDSCKNICLSRVNLEIQRDAERINLNNNIKQIEAKIDVVNQKKLELVASRNRKAGELYESLRKLNEEREKSIDRLSNELLESEIKKLKVAVVGTFQKYTFSEKRIKVVLVNNSGYALKPSNYGRKFTLAGYYQGVEIKRYTNVAFKGEGTKKDTLGFDKNYAVATGESVFLGERFDDGFQGIPLNTPAARLLVKDNGWEIKGNSIEPDQIRILDFSADFFVIPDENGVRSGAKITYSPEPVDFRKQVISRGLPQDKQIAKIEKQINAQSFPEEDSQIASLENDISAFRAEQNSEKSKFNSSKIASEIASLDKSETLCREASVAINEINDRNEFLNKLKTNLSSCRTDKINPSAIFSAINLINNEAGGSFIELPNIEQKYTAKAKQLIYKKLSSEVQALTRTSIDGAFTIDSSIDQSNSIIFAPTVTLDGARFWMQPLSLMGDSKNLNNGLMSEKDFTKYLNDVIAYGCKDCSIQEFTESMEYFELSAPNPNQLLKDLNQLEMFYTDELEVVTSNKSDIQSTEVNDPELFVDSMEQVCKL